MVKYWALLFTGAVFVSFSIGFYIAASLLDLQSFQP